MWKDGRKEKEEKKDKIKEREEEERVYGSQGSAPSVQSGQGIHQTHLC